ncbi:TRAP transporter large permease [Candidatus Chrysopegis kryptomonas]|jgi:tripartite ATP-independent transporter DctM subunit|uniref:TRAP transporter, DctM subunit n=1 Tax=Candidatus Chryseopegocella kryptomonas TaxID=1633643 RepID=A0A0P1MUZ0_9BACT|nr:TRAP transporter large permease subunit [Candidatus Chrysopegis kryptomonas]CUS99581.1 TRAP transporter, DctM subunit [Candidatus Chrysopegis kryptomonas]
MLNFILILLFVLFALFRTPLFAVISAIAILSFLTAQTDLSAIIIEMVRLANTSTLIAIPLFTFAGYILAESNTPKRLVNLTQALFGWIPGGLAIVVLVSCAVFTAFTGASGITIVALGGLVFPALIKGNYSEKFSLGLVTTSGSLGLLFPPSLPLILYALVAQVDVDKLFIAGIIPGTLLIVLLSIYSIARNYKSGIKIQKFSFRNLWRATIDAIWEIPLPFIIIGGIYAGLFTVIEASVITAVYVLIVEFFIYRDLNFRKDLTRIMKESMILVGGILIILASALGLTSYLIDAQVPMKIFEFIQKYISSKYAFLLLLNIFLLVVGMLMDIFSAIIVVVPIITPIAMKFGVDPVHLGIIFLTNLEIGYLTPPVGLNLFISSFRFEKPIIKIYTSTLPFIFILLIALLLITYIPEISLFLVK